MGQSASKGASRTAEKVARRVADAVAQATPPPPTPPSSLGAAPRPPSATTQANNPAMFLRGTGIATEDIRDKGQEMYLRNLHNIDNEKQAKGPQDMPADLLKFLQDVGPVKQTVDKEFTAPRLLEKENESELTKAESSRKAGTRERIKMPLMGGDNTFTTTRNTNFSRLSTQSDDTTNDFGLSNTLLYQLIAMKEKNGKDGSIDPLEDLLPEGVNVSQWTTDEKDEHKKLLEDAKNAIEIPVLRMDTTDGTIFGLYAKEVPGPEVKYIVNLPESKVKFVLQDLIENEGKSGDTATAKLQERRLQRKGIKSSTKQ